MRIKSKEDHIFSSIIRLKNKNVVEIGCGDGSRAKKYAQIAKHILAVDIDGKQITKAKKTNFHPNLEYKAASAENLNLSDNSADTVFMFLCFHEIDIRKQGLVLQEIHRVLKKRDSW